MKQTAENIEAEAAVVRSQLVAVAADIRHHADPSVIVDAAKSSFKRRAEDVPSFLKENATPLGMVMFGGVLGAVLTGIFSPSRRSSLKMPDAGKTSPAEVAPGARSKARAVLISSLGVGIGYVAAMFVPTSSTEERFLGAPKAVLSQHLDDFLREHTRGMKTAAANLFGVSRFSAVTLVGLAMLAEALGSRPKTDSP